MYTPHMLYLHIIVIHIHVCVVLGHTGYKAKQGTWEGVALKTHMSTAARGTHSSHNATAQTSVSSPTSIFFFCTRRHDKQSTTKCREKQSYAHMHIYIYVCVYMYVCMHAQTHTHAHTHTRNTRVTHHIAQAELARGLRQLRVSHAVDIRHCIRMRTRVCVRARGLGWPRFIGALHGANVLVSVCVPFD